MSLFILDILHKFRIDVLRNPQNMGISENAAVKIYAEIFLAVTFLEDFVKMIRNELPRFLNVFKLEFILNVQSKIAVFDYRCAVMYPVLGSIDSDSEIFDTVKKNRFSSDLLKLRQSILCKPYITVSFKLFHKNRIEFILFVS